MDKKYGLPPFKACQSKPNIVAKGIIISFFIGLSLLSVIFLGCSITWLLTPDNDETILIKIVIVLMLLVLTGLPIFLSFYFWKPSGYTGIIVDETGITHYYRDKKHIVKQLPWSIFLKNPDEESGQAVYDINELSHSSTGKALQWWEVKDGNTDKQSYSFVGENHFFLNRFSLVSTFLLGIAHFRPDLNVNPNVFSEFYIDSNEYVFQKKKYIKDIIMGLLILVVIAVIIYFGVLLSFEKHN
ncbi:hypothetical protein [Chryseobacterium herbae]|uniref:PH domain-containing protein n=1 Tax=Chryseobacterium herbae TaxID=2976476 RepID=A0ABT2IUD8_9FLAO|nr:hypothetical protein [Chryseobacterium sp. pc1-10]MCT2562121.1 hypothetical protein [Chryseobacterium sp. pc1-10]